MLATRAIVLGGKVNIMEARSEVGWTDRGGHFDDESGEKGTSRN